MKPKCKDAKHRWLVVRSYKLAGKHLQKVRCLECGKEKLEGQSIPMFAWVA